MIDFSSDTATLPTAGMKKAMIKAKLGDEQKGEDPSTRKLEEMAAEVLGQECALLFPSATMANQIAIKSLCEPGDEIIAAENSHIFVAECGGISIHSGVMPRPLSTKTGIFTGEELLHHYRYFESLSQSSAKCVSIENTTNLGGGLAWDLASLDSTLSTITDLNLKSHLDGSRIFNAAIKLGTKASQLTENFDTVTVCLSKGLGCPMGAVLAFKANYHKKVNQLKRLFGGALRQSGLIGAAGIYAFQHHIERLAEDHTNADYLAKLMIEIDSIQIETNFLSTNMVYFSWHGENILPKQFHSMCINNGIRFTQINQNRFRAVLHLGINRRDIDLAIKIIKQISKVKI